MAAAGYGANDLIGLGPARGKTMLDILNSTSGAHYGSASALFGSRGWRAIVGLQGMGTRGFRWVAAILCLSCICSVPMLAHFHGWHWGLVAVFTFLLAGGFWVWRRYRGLASLMSFRDAIDAVLAARFDGAKRPIRFQDFTKNNKPALKIVVTNISERRMEVFSTETTPHAAVADAVAASCCIPIVFRPWQIENKTYLDGGLVSNLPAWVFDEERALEPDALTIAVEINDAANLRVAPVRNWLVPAVRTAVFGRAGLNKRGAGRMITLPMDSDLGLLHFDAPLESSDPGKKSVLEEVSRAHKAALAQLQRSLIEIPTIMQKAAEAVLKQALTALTSMPGVLVLLPGDSEPSENVAAADRPRIRVAFAIQPRDHQFSLRLQYHAGFDGETDQGMLVPEDGSYAGEAFRTRQPCLILDQRIASDRQDRSKPPRVLRVIDRSWSEMQWSLNIPVGTSASAAPWLVVTIDGNRAVNERQWLQFEAFRALMVAQCDAIVGTVLKSLGGPDEIRI